MFCVVSLRTWRICFLLVLNILILLLMQRTSSCQITTRVKVLAVEPGERPIMIVLMRRGVTTAQGCSAHTNRKTSTKTCTQTWFPFHSKLMPFKTCCVHTHIFLLLWFQWKGNKSLKTIKKNCKRNSSILSSIVLTTTSERFWMFNDCCV